MSTGLITKNIFTKKFIVPYNAATKWGNGYNSTNGYNYDYRTVLFAPISMTWRSPPYVDEFGYSMYYRPISLLLVAGGGAGGDGNSVSVGGGGGGGGAVLWQDSITVTPETDYTFVVGAGGAVNVNSSGSNGGDTTAFGYTATGGGGGGGGAASTGGSSGGTGGGGATGGFGGYGSGSTAGDGGGGNGRHSPNSTLAGGGGGAGENAFISFVTSTNGASGFTGPVTGTYTTPNSASYPQRNYIYYFKGSGGAAAAQNTGYFRDSVYGIGYQGAVGGGGGGCRIATDGSAYSGSQPGVGGTGTGGYVYNTGGSPATVTVDALNGGAAYTGVGGGGGGGQRAATATGPLPAAGGSGGIYLFFWNYKVPGF